MTALLTKAALATTAHSQPFTIRRRRPDTSPPTPWHPAPWHRWVPWWWFQ
ncbi:hypothetical protein [Lentzea fradiae]|nr:hypothetical protein [Lentzea fradiae]